MNKFKIIPEINKEDVYKNENKNTFKPIDELLVMGINRNTIYREKKLKKEK